MKKLFSMLLFGTMIVGLVACGQNDEPDNNGSSKNEVVVAGHTAVDLGLSSGTLWATCNIGASTPEAAGHAFAWGETNPKFDYWWDSYKWATASGEEIYDDYSLLTKYNQSDRKTTLTISDDAAYAYWGDEWRMPTRMQFDELVSSCSWKWTAQNNIMGYKVVGSNGNSIFLPACGTCIEWDIFGENEYGYYWSSSLHESLPYTAYILGFDEADIAPYGGAERCQGLYIRPVCLPAE